MKTILVTGANGQVGLELQTLAAQTPAYQWIFTNRQNLDITQRAEVAAFFDQQKIDFCINCAAYTAVDKAESEPENAHAANVTAVENLAKACQNHHSNLIHLSSDYVYHSLTQNTPYQETDPTTPQGVYAQTKLEGEQKALEILPQTVVIRTSWVYSTFGNNFVKTMLRLSEKMDSLRVIYDQIGTPTYARDIAVCLLKIVQTIDNQPLTNFGGVYNFSNEGVTTWFDFAKTIFEIRKIPMTVAPIETKDYPTAATRPHFSVLNKAKIKSTFGIQIPHWRAALVKCLRDMEEVTS